MIVNTEVEKEAIYQNHESTVVGDFKFKDKDLWLIHNLSF